MNLFCSLGLHCCMVLVTQRHHQHLLGSRWAQNSLVMSVVLVEASAVEIALKSFQYMPDVQTCSQIFKGQHAWLGKQSETHMHCSCMI